MREGAQASDHWLSRWSRPRQAVCSKRGACEPQRSEAGAQHPEMQQTVPHRKDLPSKTVNKATGEAQPSKETHHQLRKLRSSDVGTLPEATVRGADGVTRRRHRAGGRGRDRRARETGVPAELEGQP